MVDDDSHLCPCRPAAQPEWSGNRLATSNWQRAASHHNSTNSREQDYRYEDGYEFYKPVYVGDRLGAKERLENIYIRAVRLDPEAFWIAKDTLFLNQGMEEAAKRSTLRILHREREQIAATTPEQLEIIKP